MSKNTLKKNIIANYSSQLFIVAISVLTLPKLIGIIGAESYGLIGFFSLIQSWLMLLDLGMSPTLTREIARFKGGVLDAASLLHFFNAMKKFFIWIAIGVAISILFGTHFIATSWLKSQLPYSILYKAITLMAFILTIRWLSSIYRAATVGFERLVWLGYFNSLFAVLRFIVVFFILIFIDNSIITFFVYQLIVSCLELLILIFYVKKLFPRKSPSDVLTLRPLKEVMGFSLTIAFTGAVWVVISQTDKLILSKLLPLSEYGYYSLAVQVAGAITLISGPISSAILPRLTRLEASGQAEEFISLYRQSTRIIVVIAGTASLILIFFTKKLILMWTGSELMVVQLSKFIFLYAIGNFFLAVAAFPYYLQYAKGNLKFHLYGNIGFVVILVPALIFTVNNFGGIGAGYVWIGMNAAYLFLWIPFINHYFVKGLNNDWFIKDILKIILPASIVAYLLSLIIPNTNNRFYIFMQVATVGILILLVCLRMAGELKRLKFKQINK